MAKAEFESLVEGNVWHSLDELQPTMDALKLLCTPDPNSEWRSITGWSWSKNPGWRAKYVDIRIDMRDGGFILLDRAGKRISLEQIQSQKE